jgi:toxin CcdB
MSQFDLYANPDKRTQKTYPFFVAIQNGLLESLNSRLVIPLTPVSRADKTYPDNLCPVISIAGKTYALLTQQMAAVAGTLLKKKAGSLAEYRTEIIAAVDFLITGI